MFKWIFGSKKEKPTPDIVNNSYLISPNSSGVNVNQWSGMQLPAVFACIRVLAETVAQLPLNVYQKTEKGSRLTEDHPLHYLLHHEPNEWMTSFTLREILQGHLASWGNAYCYIERNSGGLPVSLFPLLPDRTYPLIENGKLIYLTTINDSLIELKPHQVLHIPAFSFDGVLGISPISVHREAIGLGIATQRFGARFFGSGSTLAGILKHPMKLKRKADNPDDPSPVDRLRKQFSDLFSGLNNSHKIAVLEEGMSFEKIGIPPNDAQFLETRKFQISEIARIFNVPAHMIQDLDRATFNNITELSLSFLRYSMMPWLVRWEQELVRKLFITEADRKKYFVKFRVAELLRGTQQERAEYYQRAINDGWMNRNEVRRLEDLNEVENLDEFLIPLNMGNGQSIFFNNNEQQRPEEQQGQQNEDQFTAESNS